PVELADRALHERHEQPATEGLRLVPFGRRDAPPAAPGWPALEHEVSELVLPERDLEDARPLAAESAGLDPVLALFRPGLDADAEFGVGRHQFRAGWWAGSIRMRDVAVAGRSSIA